MIETINVGPLLYNLQLPVAVIYDFPGEGCSMWGEEKYGVWIIEQMQFCKNGLFFAGDLQTRESYHETKCDLT